jgi:F-type H+-transporting ATPase subunit b
MALASGADSPPRKRCNLALRFNASPMKARSLLLAALAVPALSLAATPALAQPAQGGLLDINTGLMIWTVIVFGVVLAVLYFLAYPHLLGAVEAREKRIEQLLADAEADREKAAALVREQEKSLEETRSRAQEILAESRTASEKAREEMLAETRQEQEQMMARVRRDIEQERERAVDHVRREAVDIALAAASRLIRKELDGEENRRLVEAYLDEVSGAGSQAASTVGV